MPVSFSVFDAQHWFLAVKEQWQRCCEPGKVMLVLLPLEYPFPMDQALTAEEKTRGARFRFLRDRRAFALGRWVVRTILGVDQPPIPFLLQDGGKPYLSGYPTFNVSHSGGLVAVAFAHNAPLGVDIELKRQGSQMTDLMPLVCHPMERLHIESRSPKDRSAMFYRCWTRKEAILKATGEGLRDDLSSLDVKLEQQHPWITSEPLPLKLLDIEVGWEGYSCSLAVDPGITSLDVHSPFQLRQLECFGQTSSSQYVI
ncbi:4'-phosphopantetheinyl transferase superfamily protein [Pseudovibrio sp. POLY-S9]|uniref:4'-phosphopantetheinyl transferase family protein n=1 Tax=Pseudovibrio sp. POLY-S9 TaxID=1576596 RepID=UPI0009E7ABDE|nr:4'-phosphopantetheinyl transferase superfamily protein [Pseudovibrio sp. POLY-S9]